MTKRIAPAAINALKEALTAAYWYKSDLRSFLTHSLTDPALLGKLNWNDYKRNLVNALVEHLARNEDRHQDALLRLMLDVAAMEDFSHLVRLDDGQTKVERARQAVEVLQKFVASHQELVADQEEAERRRQEAFEARLHNQAVKSKLTDLQKEFFSLVGPTDVHKRGYILERVLRQLFELFDLDPKASFRIKGEQIDGAFTFDKTDYLLEAKWQKELVSLQELDAFRGKIERKLENTLGLYLSINGFSQSAIAAHSSARPVMILMVGSHLMAVLEGRIDLLQLLLRMRRHAAQTGEILLLIHRILL